MRIHSFAWLDPNAAWLIFVAGLLLIYWEMCRPGLAVPGAVGCVCVIAAFARLMPVRPDAALCFAAAWIAMAAGAWWWNAAAGIAGAVLLTAAALAASVRWWIAVPTSALLAAATVILGSGAVRGYFAKRVM
ncbi:MAG: hypothetical protein FJW31_05780 [Acidobacteria bacterium]|nr:hypothetical protein [Acidobacteriota bacterium]